MNKELMQRFEDAGLFPSAQSYYKNMPAHCGLCGMPIAEETRNALREGISNFIEKEIDDALRSV